MTILSSEIVMIWLLSVMNGIGFFVQSLPIISSSKKKKYSLDLKNQSSSKKLKICGWTTFFLKEEIYFKLYI